MSFGAQGQGQQSTGINQLLGAERKAKSIIDEARRERQAKLRAAKDEATSEIEEYKSRCNRAIAEFQNVYRGQEASTDQQIMQQTGEVLRRVDQQLAANKEHTVKFLIQQVINIQPEMHHNYNFSQAQIAQAHRYQNHY